MENIIEIKEKGYIIFIISSKVLDNVNPQKLFPTLQTMGYSKL